MATYTNILQPATGQDAYISQANATTNYGSDTVLYASLFTAGDIRRGLMKFDLSGLIGKSTLQTKHISSATLTLTSTVNSAVAAGKIYRLLPINGLWDEFTATWNSQNSVKNWGGGAGAGTAGIDYSSSAMGAWDSTAVGVGSTRTITITNFAELIAMIKDNHGIIFIADDEASADNTPIGATSENVASYRPKLEIVYYPPAEIANDTGSNKYTGYHVGTVTQNGQSGALYAGGYTDISEFISGADFASGGSGTVFVQFAATNATGQSAAGESIISLGNGAADPNNVELQMRQQLTTNLMRYRLRTNNADFKSRLETLSDITALNTAAIVFESSARYEFYLNGVGVQSGVPNVWSGTLDATLTAIGASTTTTNQFFGTIKNVIIGYEHDASDIEISAINNGITTNTLTATTLDAFFGAGAWSWWKLDEFSGTAQAVAGSRNTATISTDNEAEANNRTFKKVVANG